MGRLPRYERVNRTDPRVRTTDGYRGRRYPSGDGRVGPSGVAARSVHADVLADDVLRNATLEDGPDLFGGRPAERDIDASEYHATCGVATTSSRANSASRSGEESAPAGGHHTYKSARWKSVVMSDTEERGEGRPSSKVARLIGEYDLGAAFGSELETRWTSDGDDRLSLRALADLFNRRLLETAMDDAGMASVDGDVENLYRLLTADDVSSGMRTEARARLEREGVDVDELEGDFVTYQAIRSYLKDYRGAEYEGTTDADRIESATTTIQRLRSRLRSVVEGNLDQLRTTGRLTLGEFRLLVDIDVLCEDCGAQYGVFDLLSRGGCDCDPGTGTGTGTSTR